MLSDQTSPEWQIEERKAASIYAAPRVVERLDECYFYHSMDLPKHGSVAGDWDLRSNVKRYLGNVDFHGKRVLDVGTASGFLAFWMEDRGAEVVGFDLSENHAWDRVPFGGVVDPDDSAESAERIRKVNNAFWFVHAQLGSKVQMVYGRAYEIPESIGPFDIATFGSILLHLRDPFLALQSALSLTTETVIVTNPLSILRGVPLALLSAVKPMAVFVPDSRKEFPRGAWWALTPRTVVEFLRVLGFAYTKVTYHVQRYHGDRRFMYTVVARRTSHGRI
jgi:SAM-dependent methyltransferase